MTALLEKTKLLKTDEILLDEQVGTVLTGPLYNDRRESGRSGADYDEIIIDDMAAKAMICKHLMKSGCHGHVFLPAFSFLIGFK